MEDPPVPLKPVCSDICDTVDEICHKYLYSYNKNARELVVLLKSLHLKALLETHDAIAKLRNSPPSPNPRFLIMPADERTEAVRMVGLRRQPEEPLVSLIFDLQIYIIRRKYHNNVKFLKYLTLESNFINLDFLSDFTNFRFQLDVVYNSDSTIQICF